jgi:hypothetical protein
MNLEFQQPFEQPPGVTFRSPYSDTFVLQEGAAGNPRWYVENIRAPDEVAAGGVVDVAVDMINKDRVVTPLNPNVCRDGAFSGLESEITVDPQFAPAKSVTDCLGITSGLNPTRRTHEFSFEAPTQPGEYEIDVTVEATGSGVGGTEPIFVVIPDRGSGGGDGPGVRPGPGDPPPGGGGGGGGEEPIVTPPEIGVVALAILLILFIAVALR